MKTKFYSRFISRMANFDADVELADILKIAIHRGALKSSDSPYLFDSVNIRQHPRLAARTATVSNQKQAANHLKATIAAAYLKDIYEDLSDYFVSLLRAAAANGLDPNRLIGEHKVTFDANDILKAGSWDSVLELVSKSVFRKLEGEKSTREILQKMNAKLNLGVRSETIEGALPYLELRHLLVHADGIADAQFCRAYPIVSATVGEKVEISYELLQSAKEAIVKLIAEFDRKVVSKKVVHVDCLQR
jgi:hypothetical protein